MNATETSSSELTLATGVARVNTDRLASLDFRAHARPGGTRVNTDRTSSVELTLIPEGFA